MADRPVPQWPLPLCRANRWWKSIVSPQSSASSRKRENISMDTRIKWTRRSFMAGISSLTTMLLGTRRLSATSVSGVEPYAPIKGFGQSGNVYEELGVTTVINGQGTMTMLGGSLMRPEVEAVMALAGQHFVSIPELEMAAGNRITEMLKLPPGYSALVTSGAAAAMQSGLAGILTRDNPQFIKQIPDLTGMKSEVIIQKSHRNAFDHQLRSTGIRLVEVVNRDDLRKAVNEKTAMMHFANFANAAGQIKVEEWAKLGKEYNVPTFIDAAADTPPVSHLWDYANMGYDLIAFSGGKAIRGPQCAGLLIGRKDLVTYALLNNSPHEDTIGRSQKVGKEEIVGMVKALELYLEDDYEALNKEWQRRLEYISAQLAAVPSVTTSFPKLEIANHVPHLQIKWDEKRIPMTPRDVGKALRSGQPSIVLSTGEHGEALSMNSFMLQPGEEKIVATELVKVLKARLVYGRVTLSDLLLHRREGTRLSAAKTSPVRWLLIFWLFVLSAVAYLDRVNISIAGSLLASDYHLSKIQLGWIFSAFLAGYALFQTPGGRLADKLGARRMLAIGVLWWGIFTALTAAVPAHFAFALLAFLGVRFALGAGEAVIYPASNQFVARWIPSAERGLANGCIFSGVGVGAGFTPPLITYVMLEYGWRWSFVVCAFVGLAVGLVWHLIARNSPEEHPLVSPDELARIQSGLPVSDKRNKGVLVSWGSMLRSRE